MLADILNDLDLSSSPGCCIGLLSEDEPEYFFQGQSGESGHPIAADTLWETASLSKPVVALLALERRVNDSNLLTQPVLMSAAEFGAAVDSRWGDLTIWNTLTHTTGLPNWRPAGELLAFDSDPGTPGYSGEGYELLLAELSARSGQTAETLLERHLRRLQMVDSSFTPGSEEQSRAAVGHTSSGEPLARVAVGPARASGSLHATAADYMRFLAAVARPDSIDDPDMQSAARAMAERSVELLPGYGRTLGWALTQTDAGDALWQHGDNPGFKHVAVARPATGEAVLVCTNSDDGQTLYRAVCARALQVQVW